MAKTPKRRRRRSRFDYLVLFVFVASLGAIGWYYGGMFLADRSSEQANEQAVAQFESNYGGKPSATPSSSAATTTATQKPTPTAKPKPVMPATTPLKPCTLAGLQLQCIGILRIPSISVKQMIVQGTDEETDLNASVGHMPRTAMPNKPGNFYIAGHRVTHGRPFFNINEIQIGDTYTVETTNAVYTYRVYKTRIVNPDQIEVTSPIPGSMDLSVAPNGHYSSLQACHPRFSAAQRYIVHAKLTGFVLK